MSCKSQNKPINIISKAAIESDWNLKATINSSDMTNKPWDIWVNSPCDKPSQRELELIKELESWKKTIKSYQDAYGLEIPHKSK